MDFVRPKWNKVYSSNTVLANALTQGFIPMLLYIVYTVKYLIKDARNPKFKCFSSRPGVVSVQYIKAMCYAENEDVAGAAPRADAPTTSEWSTILLPIKVVLY